MSRWTPDARLANLQHFGEAAPIQASSATRTALSSPNRHAAAAADHTTLHAYYSCRRPRIRRATSDLRLREEVCALLIISRT